LHRVELWQLGDPNLLAGSHLVTMNVRFNNNPDSSDQFAGPDGSVVGSDGLKVVDYEPEEPEGLEELGKWEKIEELKEKNESDRRNCSGEDS
jgi:hypothetical protein